MQPRRITTVISNLASGGAEKRLVFLSEQLAAMGHQVTLATYRANVPDFYPVAQSVARARAPQEASMDCRWFDRACQQRRQAALKNFLLETAPELVICFGELANIYTLQALKGAGVPVVISERTDPRHYHIGWRWDLLRRLTYPRCAELVLVSAENMPWARTFFPRPKARAIPNPAPTPPQNAGPRPDWFAEKNIIAMGRLTPIKGFDTLIRAFATQAESRPGWRLSILGEGPQEAKLRTLAESMGVGERVNLPGVMNPPWSALQHADIFALTSDFEGFPNALCEAMACGAACVSFDCPSGPRQIIRHGQDGLLLPPKDEQALAAALGELMDDEMKRARLGKAAQVITERLSVPRIMEQWADVVEQAVIKGRTA